MASSQEIEAARKILARDMGASAEAEIRGSCPKPERNCGLDAQLEEKRVKLVSSDLNRDDGSVVVTKKVLETETVVETSFEETASGLGVENGKNEAKNMNDVSNAYVTDSVNKGDSVGNGINLALQDSGFPDGFDGKEKQLDGKDGRGCGADETKSIVGDGERLRTTSSDIDKNAEQTGEELEKLTVSENTEIVVAGDEERLNEEKILGNKHEFRAGDLVWAKIKSHPWWPGQIYDPSNASQIAVKQKQVGRLLVAFFGDGSCSWCLPSQLIPFVENFEEMSKDSGSRSFLNAVQRALDEVCRLVESNMTCKCIPEGHRFALLRRLASNAGIKDGVLVPEVVIGRLSIPTYAPAGLLAKLRHFAQAVSVGSMIEFAVLKGWLSAFYGSKGAWFLPVYYEPCEIEGMEDDSKNMDKNKFNKDDAVMNDFSIPIEVPIGRLEDDSPTAGSGNSAAHSHGRKQKSVAELMKENPEVTPKTKKRTTVEQGKESGKSTSAKKRKGNDWGVEDGGNSGASTRKKIVGKKQAVIPESSKESENKISEAGSDILGLDVKTGDSLLSRPNDNNVCAEGNVSGEAKEASDSLSSPRERKKSKYLSPPYTNLNWREGSSSFKKGPGIESEKIGKIAHVEDRPLEKLPKTQQKDVKTSGNASEAEAGEDPVKNVSPSALDVSVTDMLSEIQSAAVNPIYLTKMSSIDKVLEFNSAFRTSVYLHDPNDKIFHKCPSGGKRKSLQSQQEDPGEDLTSETKANLPEVKNAKDGKLKNVTQSDKKRPKRADGISGMKASAGKADRKDSYTSLIMTFSPGFTMPSKDDVIRQFCRFGSLNEQETQVVADSHSVQVVFMKDSDAKEAFKYSINQNAFGTENVNYKLQPWLVGSRCHKKITSPRKKTTEKMDGRISTPVDKELSDVGIIRQKVEMMVEMLEKCSDKISTEDKSSLKDEIKSLLEKVETAVEKVEKMVEKSAEKEKVEV